MLYKDEQIYYSKQPHEVKSSRIHSQDILIP